MGLRVAGTKSKQISLFALGHDGSSHCADDSGFPVLIVDVIATRFPGVAMICPAGCKRSISGGVMPGLNGGV